MCPFCSTPGWGREQISSLNNLQKYTTVFLTSVTVLHRTCSLSHLSSLVTESFYPLTTVARFPSFLPLTATFRFHIQVRLYNVSLSLICHSASGPQAPTTLLQMATFPSFLLLNNIPLWTYPISSSSIHPSVGTWVFSKS